MKRMLLIATLLLVCFSVPTVALSTRPLLTTITYIDRYASTLYLSNGTVWRYPEQLWPKVFFWEPGDPVLIKWRGGGLDILNISKPRGKRTYFRKPDVNTHVEVYRFVP